MSKFCELAGKVTNCTDDCKRCLEEEFDVREIKVGDKVRYITEDSIEDKVSGYYRPKGLIRAVIGIIALDWPALYRIQWPEGATKGNGCWYVEKENIELV